MKTPLKPQFFVSLALPQPCQDALARLRAKVEGAIWTARDQLHLTMRFLGEVEEPLIERVEQALTGVRVQPFVLPIEGVGRFPPRGPAKALWAGIGRGSTRLYQLRQQIDDAVLSAGWRGVLRSFDPHITVGRVGSTSQRGVDPWLSDHREFVGPPFRVEAFYLMVRDPRSAEAVPLRRFALDQSSSKLS
jgi:2'-5' RNA ligase